MKTALSVILTAFAFVASYYFIFRLPFFVRISKLHEIASLFNILSLFISIALSVLVWKKTSTISNSLASHIIMGGFMTGSIGFILGFVGPLIFAPENNIGPLAGIFVTGPLGLILGMIGGGVYWKVRNNGN